MGAGHQFPVQPNQKVAEPAEALARVRRVAVDAKVGADASFERREVVALALTNEVTSARPRAVPGTGGHARGSPHRIRTSACPIRGDHTALEPIIG